jgi:hypothetical protein
VTYRAELGDRALKQMHGLPSPAFDSLVEAMAEVIDYPDDPLRTFFDERPLRQASRVRRRRPDHLLNKRRRWHGCYPRHHLGWLAVPLGSNQRPLACKHNTAD